jgi:hypothetical protein
METRAFIKFFFQGKVRKEIYAILIETLGEVAPSHATVKNLVAQLILGDFSTFVAPRTRLTKTVTSPALFIKFTS